MSPAMRAIVRDLEKHRVIFDADRIGEEVLDVAAAECLERFARQETPDGQRWDALDPDYERWKARHGIAGEQMGVLDGDMSDDEHFKGERSTSQTEASSTFGRSELARLHAEWFEEGNQGQNRPPRPFTALSAEAERRIDEFLDRHHAASL